MPREIDTTNDLLVATNGETITVMLTQGLARGITPAQAKRLAAWLVVVAEPFDDPDAPPFDEVLEAVRNT